MWTHKNFKGQRSGNYEHDKKTGKRVLFLEQHSSSGKKLASKKFKSWQHAKRMGWVKA